MAMADRRPVALRMGTVSSTATSTLGSCGFAEYVYTKTNNEMLNQPQGCLP
ncbi:hypothetical protein SAMN02745172_00299 [Pseudoxanthobacter soli DSM 19599]|uniref:Uncharacterized protein n=1 Tax=Pseudoxanthobacter soli DSM 19599 TaxID=1123029 RepID=A0A1M7Z6H8_9HYPH|nr:hypothetical protein [Pseudoxanthobacter soli]SHO60454.1 hypothetical protein SAMN02745172_00299 [Pseudoxanthobacter soli DSM 19599]